MSAQLQRHCARNFSNPKRPHCGQRHKLRCGAMQEGKHTTGKVGVLFVCLGNICRSPSAEAVFKAVVERSELTDHFIIDSCGTGGGSPDWYKEGGWSYHEGDLSDERMTATAKRRGVILTSRSRPLQPVDLNSFEYIIGMDAKNIQAIQRAGGYWIQGASGKDVIPETFKSKISLMTDYCRKFKGTPEVPDPYYGGQQGFERVLDLLDDACQGLLDSIRAKHGF